MSLLSDILAKKREEVTALRRANLPEPPPRRPIALRRSAGEPLRLLAELKRKSPSAGVLSAALDFPERARIYEASGASMLSVLTDATWFDGRFEDLGTVRDASTLPILAKEFVIDEVQLDAARAHGADAVLLIVRFIDDARRLAELVGAAKARQLEPVVEVANEAESGPALDSGAEIVGVNARDLDSLKLDAKGAQILLAKLPSSVVRLHFSSLKTADDVRGVAEGRADGALVGEALMRADDPSELLRAMVRECGRPRDAE
jgi:indole-3-glycerol phosphate synthase